MKSLCCKARGLSSFANGKVIISPNMCVNKLPCRCTMSQATLPRLSSYSRSLSHTHTHIHTPWCVCVCVLAVPSRGVTRECQWVQCYTQCIHTCCPAPTSSHSTETLLYYWEISLSNTCTVIRCKTILTNSDPHAPTRTCTHSFLNTHSHRIHTLNPRADMGV